MYAEVYVYISDQDLMNIYFVYSGEALSWFPFLKPVSIFKQPLLLT